MTREQVIAAYKQFQFGVSGIGTFIGPSMHEAVYERLYALEERPLTKVQLNQLLVLSQAGSISDRFFRYYWLTQPEHPYDVTKLPFYPKDLAQDSPQDVTSHDHLRWGLYRLYVDGLLYYGNVRAAFSALRSKTFEELTSFFERKRFDSLAISKRGPAVALEQIAKDDRYLISEMVCKTFGNLPDDKEKARSVLLEALKARKGGRPLTFKQLVEGATGSGERDQFLLSFDGVLDATLGSEDDLNQRFDEQFEKFFSARAMATRKTELYLSMVNDLDVYVATSMRT